MNELQEILKRLGTIEAEIREIKHVLVQKPASEKPDSDFDPYEDFLSLADEVSRLRTGPGAVEEIRQQREKTW